LKWNTSHDGAQDRLGAHQIAPGWPNGLIDGKRVVDVTEHPVFRNSVRSAASLYDVPARPENLELIDWNGATGLVDKLMSTYDLGGELDAGH
jgi:hypothetical protein